MKPLCACANGAERHFTAAATRKRRGNIAVRMFKKTIVFRVGFGGARENTYIGKKLGWARQGAVLRRNAASRWQSR
jgi:hypothetical protein